MVRKITITLYREKKKKNPPRLRRINKEKMCRWLTGRKFIPTCVMYEFKPTLSHKRQYDTHVYLTIWIVCESEFVFWIARRQISLGENYLLKLQCKIFCVNKSTNYYNFVLINPHILLRNLRVNLNYLFFGEAGEPCHNFCGYHRA